MILYDLNENERNPAYEELAASSLVRQYGFLKSIAAATVCARYAAAGPREWDSEEALAFFAGLLP